MKTKLTILFSVLTGVFLMMSAVLGVQLTAAKRDADTQLKQFYSEVAIETLRCVTSLNVAADKENTDLDDYFWRLQTFLSALDQLFWDGRYVLGTDVWYPKQLAPSEEMNQFVSFAEMGEFLRTGQLKGRTIREGFPAHNPLSEPDIAYLQEMSELLQTAVDRLYEYRENGEINIPDIEEFNDIFKPFFARYTVQQMQENFSWYPPYSGEQPFTK